MRDTLSLGSVPKTTLQRSVCAMLVLQVETFSCSSHNSHKCTKHFIGRVVWVASISNLNRRKRFQAVKRVRTPMMKHRFCD